MKEMGAVPLLEQLDDFFCEGVNTDAMARFFNMEESCISALVKCVADDTETLSTDSPQALELFALYRRYATLVEQLIEQFIEKEEKAGRAPPALEDIAQATMEELEGPHGTTRYLCTAYVAGALDVESFMELAEEMNEMVDYEVAPLTPQV